MKDQYRAVYSHLNGITMASSGVTDQIKELQRALNNFPNVRGNFDITLNINISLVKTGGIMMLGSNDIYSFFHRIILLIMTNYIYSVVAILIVNFAFGQQREFKKIFKNRKS